MSDFKLSTPDGEYYLPKVVGSENEIAIDISKLRKDTGFITLDEAFVNTGALRSAITFIDGEKGILRYRGFPIEQLAEKSTFLETAYLLVYGDLPTKEEFHVFEECKTLIDLYAFFAALL